MPRCVSSVSISRNVAALEHALLPGRLYSLWVVQVGPQLPLTLPQAGGGGMGESGGNDGAKGAAVIRPPFLPFTFAADVTYDNLHPPTDFAPLAAVAAAAGGGRAQDHDDGASSSSLFKDCASHLSLPSLPPPLDAPPYLRYSSEYAPPGPTTGGGAVPLRGEGTMHIVRRFAVDTSRGRGLNRVSFSVRTHSTFRVAVPTAVWPCCRDCAQINDFSFRFQALPFSQWFLLFSPAEPAFTPFHLLQSLSMSSFGFL